MLGVSHLTASSCICHEFQGPSIASLAGGTLWWCQSVFVAASL